MVRPWNIAEQVVEDPSTKLRLEFSSVHSEEMAQGRESPLHDQILYLRLWTSDRTRVATYAFTRGGQFIKATVEPLNVPDAEREARAEAMAYNEDHPQGISESTVSLPHDAGQPVDPPAGFEGINYAKAFVGDI